MIDLSDFSSALKFPLWDHPYLQDPLAAFAARSYLNEQDTMQPSGSDIKLITNGVNSCVLAQLMLNTKYANPDSVEAQTALAAARNILKFWGIEFGELEAKPPPKQPPKKPEPATLVWPPVDTSGRPRHTTLPDVYRENYYHAHEKILVTLSNELGGWSLEPALDLVLHEAYWNEETHTWRMQFSAPALPNLERFWVSHSQVKPGDEIPKDPA